VYKTSRGVSTASGVWDVDLNIHATAMAAERMPEVSAGMFM